MPLYDDEIKYIPIRVQGALHRIKILMDDLLTIVQTKPFSLILLLESLDSGATVGLCCLVVPTGWRRWGREGKDFYRLL
jgi:hypothetical protein